MKTKEILIRSMKIKDDKRGLKVSRPNNTLSDGHIKKANRNLIVMADLSKLKHEDWVVVAAYYSMYQAAMGLLTKIGLESKNHTTTAAAMGYFFGKQITEERIKAFDYVKAITIDAKYLNILWEMKQARETVQYGTATAYEGTEGVMKNAKEFVNEVRTIAEGLGDNDVNRMQKEISRLKVRDVMNTDPLTLSLDAPFPEAVKTFRDHHRVNPIPVIDAEKRVVGVLSRFDVLKPFRMV